MRVVCEYERDAGVTVQTDKLRRGALFIGNSVILNFKIKIFLAEELA